MCNTDLTCFGLVIKVGVLIYNIIAVLYFTSTFWKSGYMCVYRYVYMHTYVYTVFI